MRTVFPDHAEDRLKAEFFGGQPSGFFVEVGASHPQRGSQSAQFERRGWSGVLVEPQPDLAEQLRRSRSARVVAAACSSRENAGTTRALYLAGPHSSLNAQLVAAGTASHQVIDVPVRTLDDILDEAKALPPLDFLSIDVEGVECEVLDGFDVARWRPRLMLIEDHITSLTVHRRLTNAGYRLIRRTGLNGWYVPRADAPALGLGQWQIVRKYYLSHPFRVMRNCKRRCLGQLQLRHGYPT